MDLSNWISLIPSLQTPVVYFNDNLFQEIVQRVSSLISLRNYYFPLKVCSHPFVLQRLLSLQSGVECNSENEVQLVLSLGFQWPSILFYSPGASKQEITEVLSHGAAVILDSFDQIPEKPNANAKILIRLRPEGPDDGSQYFGEHLSDWKRNIQLLIDAGVNGIHSHRFGLSSEELINQHYQFLAEAKKDLDLMGLDIKYVNVGGGIGNTRFKAITEEFNFLVACKYVSEALRRHLANVIILSEWGKSVIAPCAALVATIDAISVNQKGSKSIKLQIGSIGLQFSPSIPRTSTKKIPPGNDCFVHSYYPDEIILGGYDLSDCKLGEVVYFCNIGAYWASCYTEKHSRLPPPTYVIGQNQLHLVNYQPKLSSKFIAWKAQQDTAVPTQKQLCKAGCFFKSDGKCYFLQKMCKRSHQLLIAMELAAMFNYGTLLEASSMGILGEIFNAASFEHQSLLFLKISCQNSNGSYIFRK